MTAGNRDIAGRFRTVRRLGSGGMGSVVLAEDCLLKRPVAIKRLHPGSGPELARRFRREMRIAASMTHPNVVRLLDALVEDDEVFLVMEYVDGPTFAALLNGGPIQPERLLPILDGLADALDHIHARGIVHRDVKPANILIGADGTPKLADLGLARAADASGLTTSNGVLGTPAYLAPELFAGAEATPAADLWSLAAVASEALSGQRVRQGATPAAVALGAAREVSLDLGDRWSGAPGLADALRRGLALAPEDRQHTARALVDEIAAGIRHAGTRPPRAASGEPTAVARPVASATGGGRRRRRGLAPALGLLLAGLAGVVVALLTAGGSDTGGRRASRQAPAASSTAHTRSTATTQDTSTAPATSSAPDTSSAQQTTTTAPPPAPAAGPSTPDGAVQAFYQRAAAHRFSDAWALAGPGLRSQLNGYAAFRSQFSDVRSIQFGDLAVAGRDGAGATVAFTTTATHTSRVDHCRGTAQAARASAAGWVVSHIAVSCG